MKPIDRSLQILNLSFLGYFLAMLHVCTTVQLPQVVLDGHSNAVAANLTSAIVNLCTHRMPPTPLMFIPSTISTSTYQTCGLCVKYTPQVRFPLQSSIYISMPGAIWTLGHHGQQRAIPSTTHQRVLLSRCTQHTAAAAAHRFTEYRKPKNRQI